MSESEDFPKFDAFRPRTFFPYLLENINEFSIRVNYPAIAAWEDTKLRATLQDRLHDDVSKLLRTAKFFSLNSLSQTKGIDHFAVEYADDDFDFVVRCYQDRMVINKRGVLLSTFHRWYWLAVPSFGELVKSMLALMGDQLKRDQTITSVIYTFNFIAYDFFLDSKFHKNYDVLRRLITKVPGPDGAIVSVEVEPQEISRTNYLVNYWDVDKDKRNRRLLSYGVQAPSNRKYSGLWFEFMFGSGTYSDPSTELRDWVDPSLLLEDYDRVYDFLWDRAMHGFMHSLLQGYQFKTTPTYIP